MSQKETLTLERIREDIIYSIKHPLEETKDDYKKGNIIAGIVSGIAMAGVFITAFLLRYPWIIYGFFIALLAWVVIESIVLSVRRHLKVKQINTDDYEIATEKLSHVEKEQYYIKGTRHSPGRTVINYTLHFENDKPWRIPGRICVWSKERMLSDWYVYENAHRGDTFVTVTERETGKIVMAYSLEWVNAEKLL